MRTPQFRPVKAVTIDKKTGKKTEKGWRLNIPPLGGGKRVQRFFKTRELAEMHARNLRDKFRIHGTGTEILPPAQADIARRAFEMLGAMGTPEKLLTAVKDYVECEKQYAASVTFAQAVKFYVEANADRTAKHLAGFRRLLERYPGLLNELVSNVVPDQLERELPTSASYRNIIVRELHAVFNFSKERGWCREIPVKRHHLVRIPKKPVQVLNASQVRKLLNAAVEHDPELVPLLVLRIFGGVRVDESLRLDWRDIDKDWTLTLREGMTKTSMPRHIVLHPTARVWLLPHLKPSGPIAPATKDALRPRERRIYEAAGITRTKKDRNFLRKTFASASINSGWRDASGVCADLGHQGSPTMLYRHYYKSLRADEARAIFEVLPPDFGRKVIPLAAG